MLCEALKHGEDCHYWKNTGLNSFQPNNTVEDRCPIEKKGVSDLIKGVS